jgi:uncharacterized protein YjbI with pentapeptide repeats
MNEVPKDRCGYTWSPPDKFHEKPVQQSCCCRPTVSDSDHCAWHVAPEDTNEKTVAALKELRPDTTIRAKTESYGELLDGAILTGLEIGDSISLSRVALRDADLMRTNLQNGDLTNSNFDGSDFTCASLKGADLAGTSLREANLTDTVLDGADLTDALLERADLSGASLQNADLVDGHLREADLSYSSLRSADLTDSLLDRANLKNANLDEADLKRSSLLKSNISNSSLRNANLTDTLLTKAYLHDTDLKGADIIDASLSEANFSDAILTGANLSGANLQDTDLINTEINGVDLTGANLTGANITGAELKDLTLENSNFLDTNYSKANLSDDIRRWIELSGPPRKGDDSHPDKDISGPLARIRRYGDTLNLQTIGGIILLLSLLLIQRESNIKPATFLPILVTIVSLYIGGVGFLFYVHTRLPAVLEELIPVAQSNEQNTQNFIVRLANEMSIVPPPIISPLNLPPRLRLGVWAGIGGGGGLIGHWIVSQTTGLTYTFQLDTINPTLWVGITAASFIMAITAGVIFSRVIAIAFRLGYDFDVALDLNQFYVNERLGVEPYGQFLTRSAGLLTVSSVVPLYFGRVNDLIVYDLAGFGLIILAGVLFSLGQIGFRREMIRAKEARLETLQSEHRDAILTVFSESNPEIDPETMEIADSTVQIRNEIKTIPEWPANMRKVLTFSSTVLIPLLIKFVP